MVVSSENIALTKMGTVPVLNAALSLGVGVADIKQTITEISIIAQTIPVKDKLRMLCGHIPGEPNLIPRHRSTFV